MYMSMSDVRHAMIMISHELMHVVIQVRLPAVWSMNVSMIHPKYKDLLGNVMNYYVSVSK